MAKLMYQGHGSFRMVTDSGAVAYVDPYAGEGYDLPADLALVTHEHMDHNRVDLLTMKPGGVVLRAADMLIGGEYQTREVCGVRVTAVPAGNKNHDPASCVGYLILADGKTVYAAGDTSKTDYMASHLSKASVDYALLPIDGRYNMDAEEAAECAAFIGAKHTVPIHMVAGAIFSEEMAAAFSAPNKLVLRPGDEIEL